MRKVIVVVVAVTLGAAAPLSELGTFFPLLSERAFILAFPSVLQEHDSVAQTWVEKWHVEQHGWMK